MSNVSVTSDGFSYHTVELKYHPEKTDYHSLLAKCYKSSEGKSRCGDGTIYALKKYQKDAETHCCTLLSGHGILIYFTKSVHGYTIKAVVNPRRVLDVESDYLGIMKPDQISFGQFQDRFTALMRKYGFPEFLDDWTLSRVDLCVNLVFDKKKSASEVLRLAKKSLFKRPMEMETFSDPDMNRHSLRLKNGSRALTVYDKLFQMEAEGLKRAKGKKYQGVLRVELQLKHRALKEVCQKTGLWEPSELLQFLGENSQKMILKAVQDVFPDGSHWKPKEAIKRIRSSHYQKHTKEQLIWLVKRLRYAFTENTLIKNAKTEAGLSVRTVNKRLDQLKKLGIHPIPLRSDFYLDRLPSLPDLLSTVDEDGLDLEL